MWNSNEIICLEFIQICKAIILVFVQEQDFEDYQEVLGLVGC